MWYHFSNVVFVFVSSEYENVCIACFNIVFKNEIGKNVFGNLLKKLKKLYLGLIFFPFIPFYIIMDIIMID